MCGPGFTQISEVCTGRVVYVFKKKCIHPQTPQMVHILMIWCRMYIQYSYQYISGVYGRLLFELYHSTDPPYIKESMHTNHTSYGATRERNPRVSAYTVCYDSTLYFLYDMMTQ